MGYRESVGVGADQNDGRAVCDENRKSLSGQRRDENIAFSLGYRVVDIDDVCAVYLPENDQVVPGDARSVGHSPSILVDRGNVVADVIGQIQCVVGRDTETTGPAGHERIHPHP